MSNGTVVWVTALTIVALTSMPLHSVAEGPFYNRFPCRDADMTDYLSGWKEFYVYSSGTTCHNGAGWCIKTLTSDLKLPHYHFTENFDAQEQEDADRYARHHWPVESVIGVPTTSFNCHAYALYARDDIWLDGASQAAALADDFEVVAGTECEPYEEDDVCAHCTEHSSLIEEVLMPYDWGPAYAALFVRAKWGAAGKYVSYDSIQYGDPTEVYRPK